MVGCPVVGQYACLCVCVVSVFMCHGYDLMDVSIESHRHTFVSIETYLIATTLVCCTYLTLFTQRDTSEISFNPPLQYVNSLCGSNPIVIRDSYASCIHLHTSSRIASQPREGVTADTATSDRTTDSLIGVWDQIRTANNQFDILMRLCSLSRIFPLFVSSFGIFYTFQMTSQAAGTSARV